MAAINDHIRKSSITLLSQTFAESVFHCEDKQASSLRIFCPRLHAQAITKTFTDKDVFDILDEPKETILANMVEHFDHNLASDTLGHWVVVNTSVQGTIFRRKRKPT